MPSRRAPCASGPYREDTSSSPEPAASGPEAPHPASSGSRTSAAVPPALLFLILRPPLPIHMKQPGGPSTSRLPAALSPPGRLVLLRKRQLRGRRVSEHFLKDLAAHGLMDQQIACGELQLLPPPGQDLFTPGIGPVHDRLDLLVDLACHLLGVGPGLGHGAADEHFIVLVAVGDGPQPLAHAVLGDHSPAV